MLSVKVLCLATHFVLGSIGRGSSTIGGCRSRGSAHSSTSAGCTKPRTCSADGHALLPLYSAGYLLLHSAGASTSGCTKARRHKLDRLESVHKARPRRSICGPYQHCSNNSALSMVELTVMESLGPQLCLLHRLQVRRKIEMQTPFRSATHVNSFQNWKLFHTVMHPWLRPILHSIALSKPRAGLKLRVQRSRKQHTLQGNPVGVTVTKPGQMKTGLAGNMSISEY